MQGPLGRRVEHDPRSKAYPFKAPRRVAYRSVLHYSHIPVLDQGSLGSCVGNAIVGVLSTDPFYLTLPPVVLNEELAVDVYSGATRRDIWPETFPPTDSGTSGLAGAKEVKERGYIAGYQHALTFDDALGAVQATAVITGIAWPSSFDEPDDDGFVDVTAGSYDRGGHEIYVDGYDADLQRVWFRNSWGPGYGKQGRACMPAATWRERLRGNGDATIFVPLDRPAPQPDPDVALVNAFEPWAATVFSRLTKAGKLKAAFEAWRRAKAL